jgi:hypothetical protein
MPLFAHIFSERQKRRRVVSPSSFLPCHNFHRKHGQSETSFRGEGGAMFSLFFPLLIFCQERHHLAPIARLRITQLAKASSSSFFLSFLLLTLLSGFPGNCGLKFTKFCYGCSSTRHGCFHFSVIITLQRILNQKGKMATSIVSQTMRIEEGRFRLFAEKRSKMGTFKCLQRDKVLLPTHV